MVSSYKVAESCRAAQTKRNKTGGKAFPSGARVCGGRGKVAGKRRWARPFPGTPGRQELVEQLWQQNVAMSGAAWEPRPLGARLPRSHGGVCAGSVLPPAALCSHARVPSLPARPFPAPWAAGQEPASAGTESAPTARAPAAHRPCEIHPGIQLLGRLLLPSKTRPKQAPASGKPEKRVPRAAAAPAARGKGASAQPGAFKSIKIHFLTCGPVKMRSVCYF